MHAYLIIGTTIEELEATISNLTGQWKISPFDQLRLTTDTPSIGIAAVRTFVKELFLTPRASPFVVGIIPNAETLTIEAQNALLKTLEEPPPKAKLIITTTMPDALLPTIASRCQTIKSEVIQQVNQKSVSLDELYTLQTTRVGQVLKSIDAIAVTREDALRFVDNALLTIHTAFLSDATHPFTPPTLAKLAEKLLKARKNLTSNVNPKLTLDTTFLEARQG